MCGIHWDGKGSQPSKTNHWNRRRWGWSTFYTINFLPVIPAMRTNFTVKIIDIIDIQPYKYAVTYDSYPEEVFIQKSWHHEKSSDNKFYLFDGMTMFSFGSIRLVCPVEAAVTYRESLKFVLGSKEYDDIKRQELRLFATDDIQFFH